MSSRRKLLLAGLGVALGLCLGLVIGILRSGYKPGSAQRYEGSVPARSLVLPADTLARAASITPMFPSRDALRGAPVALVVTCLSCRSGDVLGGFLGRMTTTGIPDSVDLRIVATDGDAQTWRKSWNVPRRWKIHIATGQQGQQLTQRVLRTGTSGQIQIYDRKLRWRSTWHLGQLTVDGVRNDMSLVAR